MEVYSCGWNTLSPFLCNHVNQYCVVSCFSQITLVFFFIFTRSYLFDRCNYDVSFKYNRFGFFKIDYVFLSCIISCLLNYHFYRFSRYLLIWYVGERILWKYSGLFVYYYYVCIDFSWALSFIFLFLFFEIGYIDFALCVIYFFGISDVAICLLY